MTAENGESAGWRPEDRVEPENKGGAPSIATQESGERSGAGHDLVERLLDRKNMNRAYRRVKSNKGAAGIDGMTVDEMLDWLRENREEFLQSLRKGTYKPKPVRRRTEIRGADGHRPVGTASVGADIAADV